MEPGKYYPPHHRQAMRDAFLNNAVRHALETVRGIELEAMRQAIFDNADLQLAEKIELRPHAFPDKMSRWAEKIKLRPDAETARLQQDKWNQERQERAPNFKSAVRPQPPDSVAQGPNGGHGFQTHRRPVPNQLKVLKKKLQSYVKKEFRTLADYANSCNNPPGRSAQGQKMCPLPNTFIRGTGRHVSRSPSCFANGLQRRQSGWPGKERLNQLML